MRLRSPQFVLALFFLFIHVGLWLQTHGTPATRDFTDSFGAWISAENLAHPKVPNPFLLEDAATSADPKAHPYWYSHNGNFPVYFWAPWVALGLGISTLSLLSGLILAFGLFLGYRLIKTEYGNLQALAFVLVSIFNFYGVMLTGLNLVWTFSFPLFWGAALLEYRDFEWRSKRTRRLLMAVIALTWYFEWGFSLFVTLTVFIARWLRTESMPRRWAFTTLLPAVILSLSVRFFQVGATIGFNTLLDDIFYTVSNRAFSTPTREFLRSFYEGHHLVLWGYQDQIFSADFWGYSFGTLVKRITSSFFPGSIVIFAPLALAAALISRFPRVHRRLKFPIELRASIIAAMLLFLLIPSHLTHLYVHPFQPLMIFPGSLLLGVLLHAAWQVPLSSFRIRVVFRVLGVLLLLCWPWLQFREEPLRALPGPEVFSAFRNRSFATNYLAAYPRYYTGQWATTVWGTTDENAFQRSYIHEANRSEVNYEEPDYFLCINNPYVAPCRVAEHFYRTHARVASGNGYAIFDLRKRKERAPFAVPIVANQKWLDRHRLTLLEVENLFNSSGSESGWSAMGKQLSAGWQVRVLPETKFPWGVVTDRVARIEVETRASSPALNTLAFLPRPELPMGFFSHVHVEGSQDRFSWKSLSEINQKPVPVIGDWSTWTFPNDIAFRFYRLTFSPTPGAEWLALSEIRLANSVPLETLPLQVN